MTAAVVLVGAVVWFVPFLERPRQPISSTGASPPFSTVTPVPLRPASTLCMRNVTIDTNAAVAEFTVIPGRRPAPALRVSARGPGGYRSPETSVPGGYRRPGRRSAAIQPPARPLIGQVCVRNAGRDRLALVGTTEERTIGREETVLDGRAVKADVQLTLLEGGSRTVMADVPEAVRRMATFKGAFVSPGLLWVMLGLVALAVPALVVAAVAGATRRASWPPADARGGRGPR